ncbi:Uncharacterised protein [Sebaldella termitidis]|uniref:Uncharacterized protein n=1 Tax=Sebaldella termitidis (strain ATCC 33386 / NCTC 11300) TaxID=526218 RepID=D1AN73_SEBTE|nr:hypothetical protein [Sebaldella termitidis]ACZ09677.1 hypothetical protein Sterm_2833 [Sebaldella termitidis ATCC 33386]SUI25009.1 Uncharacterised protein [Sebaldella termitidis]
MKYKISSKKEELIIIPQTGRKIEIKKGNNSIELSDLELERTKKVIKDRQLEIEIAENSKKEEGEQNGSQSQDG